LEGQARQNGFAGQAGQAGGIVNLTGDEFIAQNIDTLCTHDDELMEKYVNGERIEVGYFNDRLYRYTRKGELYPVFFGSALYGVGVDALLDRLPDFIPVSDGDGGRPLSGAVFKIDNSGKEKIAYVRLFHGCIRVREMLKYNGREEKVTRLARLENGKLADHAVITAGDIGVVYIKGLRAGDVLGEPWEGMREARLGRPTISAEVQPEQPGQKRELYEALVRLADEDPMLALSSANKLAVRMFGEIQMEILQELLLEQYGIAVKFLEATTIYMETPKSATTVRAPMGGFGTPFRAGAGFRVEPLPRGGGLVYTTEVSFGNLEKTFQTAVEEAVYDTCRNGLYGWEVTDAKITFEFSQYDSVTSTPSDYRDLAPLVLMQAFGEAGMELLEPVFEFELRVPGYAAGKALYDCERMRADIIKTAALADENGIAISGLVPADTCKNYGVQVASYTEGRGMFVTKFHGYRETAFDGAKVNTKDINIAANKTVYLMHKSGAR
jgi:ribosomal protection tetracycline resistance protein